MASCTSLLKPEPGCSHQRWITKRQRIAVAVKVEMKTLPAATLLDFAQMNEVIFVGFRQIVVGHSIDAEGGFFRKDVICHADDGAGIQPPLSAASIGRSERSRLRTA